MIDWNSKSEKDFNLCLSVILNDVDMLYEMMTMILTGIEIGWWGTDMYAKYEDNFDIHPYHECVFFGELPPNHFDYYYIANSLLHLKDIQSSIILALQVGKRRKILNRLEYAHIQKNSDDLVSRIDTVEEELKVAYFSSKYDREKPISA